jgi:hypothetical protein
LSQELFSLDLPRLRSALTGFTQAGKSPAWKLNQELQATVIATKANQTRLRIEGQTFETQTAIALKPGQSLLIKVVSLEPQISFALINPATKESGATAHQSVVISEKLVQMESARTRSSIADLINLINNHSASALRSLPSGSPDLLAALQKQAITKGQLSDPGKLKLAVEDSGLLFESKVDARTKGDQTLGRSINGDLKGQLLKLMGALGAGISPVALGAGRSAEAEAFGITQYRNNEQNALNTRLLLLNRTEQALTQISTNQGRTLHETQQGSLRWLFELPVNFGSYSTSIPLFISHGRANIEEIGELNLWKASFTVDLPRTGKIEVEISIHKDSVYVVIGCEQGATRTELERHAPVLMKNLGLNDLQLASLRFQALHTEEN